MIKIISENENGNKVVTEASREEWVRDFWDECRFVPTNNDNVLFVAVDGTEIPLEKIANETGDGQLPVYFEHVAAYLGFRQLDYERENDTYEMQ